MLYLMLGRLAILGLLLSVAGAIGIYRTLPCRRAADLQGRTHIAEQTDTLLAGLPEDVNQQVAALKRLSPQALQTYQQARLKADIHRLACGQVPVDDGSAEVLYGPDFREKVARYKASKERNEYILSASLLGLLIGGGLLILSTSLALARVLLAGIRWLWRQASVKKQPPPPRPAQPKQVPGRPRVATASGRPSLAVSAGPVVDQQLPYLRDEPDPPGTMLAADEDRSCLSAGGQTATSVAMVGQKTVESGPIISTLSQLNEQISAIRQYAAQQQQRVARLESGYDWNIIRTFCLKIIRCMDNLEDRICQDASRGLDTEQLEQVHDELLFALEASGLEQFRPQVGQTMEGLHGQVEVAKERQAPPNPALTGRIAQVLRPGYRYLIDHQRARVVRMARVRLYG